MSVNQVSASVNQQEAASSLNRLSQNLNGSGNSANSGDSLSFKSLLDQGMQAAQPVSNTNATSNQNVSRTGNQNSNKTGGTNQTGDNSQQSVENNANANSTNQTTSAANNSKSTSKSDGSNADSNTTDSKDESKKTTADSSDPNANAQLLAMLGATILPGQNVSNPTNSQDTGSQVAGAGKSGPLDSASANSAVTQAADTAADSGIAATMANSKANDAKTIASAKDSKTIIKTDVNNLRDDKNSKLLASSKPGDAASSLDSKAEALKAINSDISEAANAAKQSAKSDNFKQVLESAGNLNSGTNASNTSATQQATQAIIGAATSMQQLQSPAAVEMSQLAPRVGSAGWDKAVGQKVVWMVGEGLQSAELTLNPPDLGPLHVVLKVTNDQASASFTAAQPEVREALESALPRLRQMMGDAGIQLAGFSVGSQNAGQQQAAQQGFQQNSGSGSRNTSGNADNISISSSPIVTRTVSKTSEVDTFA